MVKCWGMVCHTQRSSTQQRVWETIWIKIYTKNSPQGQKRFGLPLPSSPQSRCGARFHRFRLSVIRNTRSIQRLCFSYWARSFHFFSVCFYFYGPSEKHPTHSGTGKNHKSIYYVHNYYSHTSWNLICISFLHPGPQFCSGGAAHFLYLQHGKETVALRVHARAGRDRCQHFPRHHAGCPAGIGDVEYK